MLTPLLAKRAVASCVLVLLCFQSSRYFLIIELDQFLCLEANHVHAGAALSSQSHHHEAEEALPHNHDAGYAFDHCKDTFNGIALTPVQPLGLPTLTAVHKPPMTWATVQAVEQQVAENFLSPPLQPPRS